MMNTCRILTRHEGETGPEVLCLGAHADDIEIGCGGTVLRICQEFPGAIVHWIVLGAHGPRAEEARAGAVRFRTMASGGEVIIMDFRDGFFPFEGAAIKEFFEDLKTRISPDLIFTHYRFDRHQDHRLVSDLTWNTWRDHTILEYEVPKWDGDLGVPNGFVPLTRAAAERKTEEILSVFATQKDKPWFTADTFLSLMRLRGNECRAEEGFAEAFHARKLALL
ncbi:MAG: PIG-L deacetylase family protein [Gemmatimonadota bacterium]